MPNVIAEGVVKLTASGGPMGAAISQELAKLRAPLGQVKAAGESSATSIGSSFTKAGGMIAAGMAVAGAAAVGFALKSASVFKDVGGEVLKVQRYMGGSAEAASKWRFVAQQSGVDTDKFAKSMLGLSKAVENNNPALEKYGIATLDAKGKTLGLDQILLNVADKFKSMPSGIDKNTLASDLFGKKLGGDLIPMLNKGRAGLEALEKQAQKYGLVLSTSNLAAIKASTVATREQSAAWQGLQVQIGSNVLPLTTKLTTAFTEGLVKVMPLISSGMNTLVIPAFSALTSVLGGTVSFIGAHQGLVKGLAVVIGAALVPAVVAWGVAQAVVLAENVTSFLLGAGSAAVQAAGSIGILTGSLEGGTVAFAGMKAASSGVISTLGPIGLAIGAATLLQAGFNREVSKLKASAVEAESGVTDLNQKITDYQAKLKSNDKNWDQKLFGSGPGQVVFGAFAKLDGILGGSTAKHAALASAVADAKKKLDDEAAAAKATADETSTAGDTIAAAFTTSGLKIRDLGNATSLTSVQVQALAGHLGIDLSQKTAGTTEKLVAAAMQLGYTSQGAQRLGHDTEVLSSWMSTASEKATAFSDALDALAGVAISADEAEINNKQSITALAEALIKGKHSLDENTVAGQTNMKAIDDAGKAALAAADAIYKQSGSMDAAKAPINEFITGLTNTLTAAHYTSDQIKSVIDKLGLTPAAIAQMTPAVASGAGAFSGLASAAGGAGAAVDNLASIFARDAGKIQAYADQIGAAGRAASYSAGHSGGLNVQAAALVPAAAPIRTYPNNARAAGGPVTAGVPYWVGEQGPEPFIPKTDGTILPHSVLSLMTAAAAGRGAGSVTVVHHHHHVAVHVAGSVTAEHELVQKIRGGLETYWARSGRR